MTVYIIEIILLLFGALALIALLRAYVSKYQPIWVIPLAQRRLSLLFTLIFTLLAVEISISVLGERTSKFDTAFLLYLRAHISPGAHEFFEMVTWSGSSRYLIPAIALCCISLWLKTHRQEAVLLAGSGLAAMLTTFLLKLAVARDRPALWETAYYWGASFPSGHTLGTAACAIAGLLCVRRLWPKGSQLAAITAVSWIFLVGLSRLVLGVHWPTDVLAAACIGMTLAFSIDLSLEILIQRRLLRGAIGT